MEAFMRAAFAEAGRLGGAGSLAAAAAGGVGAGGGASPAGGDPGAERPAGSAVGLPGGGGALRAVCAAGVPGAQLEATAITVYNSRWALKTLEHARRVAVNKKFLCYALVGKSQQGLVRVIDRASGARTLLRGHRCPLTDIAFASGRPLLATAGAGELYVRYLGEEAGNISEEQSVKVLVKGGTPGRPSIRVAWRDSMLEPRWLAFSADDRVFLLPAPLPGSSSTQELNLVLDSETDPAELHCVPSAGGQLSACVTDLEFSPGGSHLAVSLGGEGTMAVFALNELVLQEPSIKANHRMIATAREEFGGVAVDSVRWVGEDALVTGTRGNRCVQLWRLQEKASSGEKRTFELVLEHELTVEIEDERKGEAFYLLEVDIPSGLVVLASAHPSKHAMATLHFRVHDGPWGFDYVCVFSTAMPTVSFSTIREGDSEELSLYCVQSDAINQFILGPSECSPSGGDGSTVAATSPPAEAADEAQRATDHSSVGSGSVGSAPFARAPQPPSSESGEDEEDEDEDVDEGSYSLMAHLQGTGLGRKGPAKKAPTVEAVGVESHAIPAALSPKQSGLLTPEAILQQARLAVQDLRSNLPRDSDEEESDAPPVPVPQAVALVKPDSCASLVASEAAGSVASGGSADVVALKREMLAQQAQIEQSLMNMIETRLVKPLNKQSQMMESRINRKLDEIKEDFNKKVGDQRKTTEKVLLAVAASLNKDLPLNLERIIQREIGQMAETIVEGVVPQLAAAFESGGALQQPLDAALARQLPDALRAPLKDGMKANFERTLIPAFEVTCRTAFGQIHAAVEAGMAHNLKAAEGHAQTLLAAAEDVRAAARGAARDAVGSTGSAPAPSASRSAPMSLEEIEARQDPTVAIKLLLAKGEVEDAFTTALGTQNVEMVTWLCKTADLKELLEDGGDGRPPALSQGVLLALLQQLSVGLAEDAKQRMPWVQSVVLLLDTDDILFQKHMKLILTNLAEALKITSKKKLKNSTGQALTLCQHLVNSQLAVLQSKK